MPLREYQARDPARGCERCLKGFERLESGSDEPLECCPHCGAPVARQLSAPAVGSSRSGFDQRAKNAGFHQLKRVGKGEYEKRY